MNETNAWNTIPLEDYEQHMQHEDVGQAQLLNQLTGKYLPNGKSLLTYEFHK